MHLSETTGCGVGGRTHVLGESMWYLMYTLHLVNKTLKLTAVGISLKGQLPNVGSYMQ